MEESYLEFRCAVSHLAERWLINGLPSRQGLEEAAVELDRLREKLKVCGIWENAPSMLTATLDDGLGQGLAIIERFASAIGIRLISLGVMQSPAVIVEACRQHRPEYLGLTILQFDSEDNLAYIASAIPGKTRIVAGGPVFSGDPGFAGRTGTHHAAKNVASFLRIMLDIGVETC